MNPTAKQGAIKVRKKGTRAWYFLTPSGGRLRLRIHAALYRDKAAAQAVIDASAAANPDYEWKAVNI